MEGAASGEILRAASQITPGSYDSWYKEWQWLADQIATQAATADSKFTASAREAHFRAASYYRAADFFLHANPSDPRIQSVWASMLDNFEAAAKLLPSLRQELSWRQMALLCLRTSTLPLSSSSLYPESTASAAARRSLLSSTERGMMAPKRISTHVRTRSAGAWL
jgi:hypothetical protein